MRKNKVKSGTYSVDVTWYPTDSDEEVHLIVDYYYSPEEKPQYYESRGRLPCPGAPAQIEVEKIEKEDGTTLEWDDQSDDFKQYVEEQCWEDVEALSEHPYA